MYLDMREINKDLKFSFKLLEDKVTEFVGSQEDSGE
jgi:hypothetical protein